MSNDFSGPGSGMAVRHLVCVFEGAPGPVQEAAMAMPDPASDTRPNSAGASTPVKDAIKFDFVDMNFSFGCAAFIAAFNSTYKCAIQYISHRTFRISPYVLGVLVPSRAQAGSLPLPVSPQSIPATCSPSAPVRQNERK